MLPENPDRVVGDPGRTLPRVATLCTALVIVGGLAVLVGWVIDSDTLKSLSPKLASMKVNTALSLMALAVAITTRNRALSWAMLAFAGTVAFLSLLQYVVGIDLGIDEVFFDDPQSGGNNQPGRMAAATALGVLCLTGAVVALRKGWNRVSQTLGTVSAALGFLAILGYVFGAEDLYAVVLYSTVAVTTAIALLVLAVAALALVPNGILPRMVLDQGPGGTLARRLVPLAVIGLPVLGYLRLQGEVLGWYGPRFGSALMIALAASLLLFVTWRAAVDVAAVHKDRVRAYEQLRVANANLAHSRELERQRAEGLSESLAGEQARFASAVSQLEDVVWCVEVLPDELRLVYMSPNGRAFLGEEVSTGSVLERLVERLLEPPDRAAFARFGEQMRRGESAEAEVRFRSRTAPARWVWLRGVPRHDGERLLFDGIWTDVTERHALAERREEMLRTEQEQVRQLKDLNQLREEFLAVAGHELRTPLTAIQGFGEILADDPALGPDQQVLAEVIRRRSAQVKTLVDELFDLTRITSGAVTLDLVPVDLAAAITERVAGHRATAQANGVTFEVCAAELTVASDPMRLGQILDNLLSNAVKYSPSGGAVTITVDQVADQARVQVADRGIGIATEDLSRVFERMFRSVTAKDSGIYGTGLGLSVAKALVDAHGGTIAVEQNPGGGTVFTMHLPLVSARVSSRPVTAG